MKERIVIVGSGAAAVSAIRTLREQCGDRGHTAEVVVVSRDRTSCSRILLTEYLAGRRDREQIAFVSDDFYKQYEVVYYGGEAARRIDRENRLLYCENRILPFDKLILCNGGNSFLPPIPGLNGQDDRVCCFHEPEDVERILAMCGKSNRFVVLGGGPIGLDVASALLERKERVTVVEGAPRIVPRQMDDTAAQMLQERFEARGAEFCIGAAVTACETNEAGHCTALCLADGRKVEFDLLIVAAGVRAQTELLSSAGLLINGSPKVDEYLCAGDEHIYAAGDAAGLTGIWPEAVQQGRIAARNALGAEESYPTPFVFQNTINFFGLKLMSAGLIEPGAEDRVICRHDGDSYTRLVLRGTRLIGALLVGNLKYAGVWHHLVATELPLDPWPELWEEGHLSVADLYGSNVSAHECRRACLLSTGIF